MAKKTLLSIVQDILSDTDGDEVNSIADTTEAMQVATIVATTYTDLMTRKYMPHLRQLFSLSATSSATPTHMKLPDDIMSLEYILYDVKDVGETNSKYNTLKYVEPEEFLQRVLAYDSDNANVDEVTDPSGLTLKIRNDVQPSFWTSFDDEYVVFNSYDSDVETNLQSSKSMSRGYIEPSLVIDDDTIPDLPSEAVPYLLSESKTHVMAKVKQVSKDDASFLAEVARNKRQNTFLQRNKWRTHKQDKYPNYGRK
jgi:hypothetical protein